MVLSPGSSDLLVVFCRGPGPSVDDHQMMEGERDWSLLNHVTLARSKIDATAGHVTRLCWLRPYVHGGRLWSCCPLTGLSFCQQRLSVVNRRIRLFQVSLFGHYKVHVSPLPVLSCPLQFCQLPWTLWTSVSRVTPVGGVIRTTGGVLQRGVPLRTQG